MHHVTTTVLTLALLFALGCQSTPAGDQAGAPTTADEPPPLIQVYTVDGSPADIYRQQNEAVEAALKPIISIKAGDYDLQAFLRFVQKQANVPFFVDWAALERVGVDPDSLLVVTHPADMPMTSALEHYLDQVKADAGPYEIPAYSIRKGVVIITTLRELKAKPVPRVYNLDWFANHRPSLNKQLYSRNNGARRMLGMTTLQEKNVDPAEIKVKDLKPGFCANCDTHHDRLEVALQVLTYYEKIDQIIEMVQTTVGDPDEWLDEESTVTEINGMLFVKTSPENHDHIRRLFESMRLEQARKFKQQAMDMEVALLLESAESARLKQDYKAALDKINQALRVDPNSLEARALKEIVTATMSR
ncbi:MAG: hypothetical protein AAF085_15460 [Planctomycetota bacterium]